MEMWLRAFSSIGVLLLLILGVSMLKHIGLLKEEYGQMCSALVVKVTLPALIFVTLIHADFSWDYGGMGILLVGSSVVCLGLGWLIARAFRLDGPRSAPVILATGFSSSAILGVPLIGEFFPDTKELVVEAVVISTLGMFPLTIMVGTMIAMYYGASELTPKERRKATLVFFRSPIFIALVSGFALAGFTDHDNSIAHSFLDGFELVSSGNTLMVLLAVGLSIQLREVRGIVGITVCVALVNLLVRPLILMPPAHALNLEHWEIEVLALEGAMPATVLAVVLCQGYGCDARLAAKLVVATIAGSVITIPLVFIVAGIL